MFSLLVTKILSVNSLIRSIQPFHSTHMFWSMYIINIHFKKEQATWSEPIWETRYSREHGGWSTSAPRFPPLPQIHRQTNYIRSLGLNFFIHKRKRLWQTRRTQLWLFVINAWRQFMTPRVWITTCTDYIRISGDWTWVNSLHHS